MVGERKTTHLPDGLPSRFTGVKDGLTQLCKFLGILNREQKQGLLKDDRVKRAVRGMKARVQNRSTSERERTLITAFYKLRRERVLLWQEALAMEQGGDHTSGLPVPSLEYHAVAAYDPEFIKRTLNDEQLTEVLSDFPDTVSSVRGMPEWQRVVLGIWSDLQEDLVAWSELERDRRDAVALALFAVATIFDDSQFLHRAAALVDALRDEFAFALPTEASDATPSVAAEAGTKDPVQKWRKTCTAVANFATRLGGDPPQPELLQDLRAQVRTLDELHDTIVAWLDTSQSENLVAALVTNMGNLASEYDVPWLQGAIGQIVFG